VSARLTTVRAWAAGFESDLRSAQFWRRTIFVSSGATLLLVGVTQLPPFAGFFRLWPWPTIALVAVRLLGYVGFLAWERRRGVSTGYFAAGALAMGFSFQLVVASLVVNAEAPGAFMLAVLSVVGAAYNAMILRATPRFPWPALVHAVAMGLCLAMRPTTPYVEIFAVAGPLAVGGGLFLGVLSEGMANARHLLEEHRRAISASALEERSGEARRLSSTLLELLQRSHDASSALSTALLDAELLADLIRRGEARDTKELQAAARSLRDALRRVAHDAADARPAGGDPSLGSVLVLPVVRAAFAEAARRFPGVSFAAQGGSGEAEIAEATLRGGAPELERLVAELAKNACEGDGTRGATRLVASIDVAREPGSVQIRLSDDGPGLPDVVLVDTPTAFVTTKPGGSGLGLYTAARVLGASGGALTLENAPGGGAVVTLSLLRR
jgi:signal transduction histidine kinase